MATEVSPRVTDQSAPAGGRSPLRLVVIVAMLVVAASGAASQVFSGRMIPPEMGFTIGGLIGAAVTSIPWRWAVIVPLILSVLGVGGSLTTGFPQYALSHPTEQIPFITLAIQYGMLILCAGVCLVMLVQAFRGAPGRSPRWVTPAITGMVGLTLGALLIGAIAQPTGATGAASTTAGTQTVHLTPSTFAPDIIALHAGDTLTVVDDSPTPHILANGTWSASNQEQPGVETGAPAINDVQVNNNTVVLGPFTTPGTYHIFCTVHPGMNLTVIVQ